ncbi:Ran-specific GTPase-activating protein, partial [Dermatophagoides pteronyssinus]
MEDDEDIIVNLRARIYRYDTNNGDEEPEFKERGTGTVKILQHKQTGMYRILMRREKTFKICANHYITGSMKLNKHNNSEKVFLYSTLADFYENESNPETFAIRFSNAENASIFKEAFDEAVEFMIEQESDDKEESI